MRISRDKMYIDMAKLLMQRGNCERAKVGCLITHENRVISSGYNGPIVSSTHVNCKTFCDHTQACQLSMHAEANAIAFAAKIGIPLFGTILYCTTSPCANCARLIVQAGIKEVVYAEEYRNREGIEILQTSNIITRKINA